jgi:decaprenylphospho-beta-D-erythro-pentofuranosid-2-ulose 2-reductase
VKKILIFGASSAIAMAAARLWAKAGCELVLVARHEERLNNLKNDLLVRGASNVKTYCVDLAQISNLGSLVDQVWPANEKMDIALIAHGTLSNQAECQNSIELTLQEIQTNAISPILLLTTLANRFSQQGFGAIAAISSVAGDRGRQSNYVYGSAKALLSTFMSGLRQRLYQSKVRVIDIKPGFVDTPMTQEFRKGPLWATPDGIAPAIVKACEKSNGNVYVPSFWFVIMTIIQLVPEFIFKRIRL